MTQWHYKQLQVYKDDKANTKIQQTLDIIIAQTNIYSIIKTFAILTLLLLMSSLSTLTDSGSYLGLLALIFYLFYSPLIPFFTFHSW